jgi:hypothetical protein
MACRATTTQRGSTPPHEWISFAASVKRAEPEWLASALASHARRFKRRRDQLSAKSLDECQATACSQAAGALRTDALIEDIAQLAQLHVKCSSQRWKHGQHTYAFFDANDELVTTALSAWEAVFTLRALRQRQEIAFGMESEKPLRGSRRRLAL